MKIVFFGTPRFAAEILTFLLDNGVDVAAVVSKPDKPVGRSGKLMPTAVKQVAIERGLTLHQPVKASSPDFVETLRPLVADLFVVVAYGEIIKESLLQMPPIGCINVHASLLPKYRGAAPIQHAIVEGEKVSGVTIMHMAKKMDAGAIIKQVEVPVGPNLTAGELTLDLCHAGKEALLEVIQLAKTGVLPEEEQDHTLATFAPKLELEDGEVNWDRPAQELHNFVRGLTPAPGAWTTVLVRGESKRLKLLRTEVGEGGGVSGSILCYDSKLFEIACSEGSIRLLEVQLEGKKRMEAEAFMRGISRESFALV